MGWTCVNNDGIGYCDGEPEFSIQAQKREVSNVQGQPAIIWRQVGGKCKLNKETCGKFKKSLSNDETAKLNNKEVVFKHINPNEQKEEKQKVTTKSKGKKDNKQTENVQGSFF